MGILFVQFLVYVCSNRHKNPDFKGSLGISLPSNIIKSTRVEFFLSRVHHILNIAQRHDLEVKTKYFG